MSQNEQKQFKDPLLPNYAFTEYILAGHTPIVKGQAYDWWIDRPQGMEGWIINITTQGLGQVFKDQDSFLVTKGDVLLFPAHVQHLYGRYKASTEWHHSWIFFHPAMHWLPLLRYKEEIRGVFKATISDEHEFGVIAGLFEEIVRLSYLSQDDVLSNNLLMNILEQILLRCFRVDNIINSQKKPKPVGKILEAVRWISTHYTQSLSIKSIAAAVSVSPQQLSSLFKAQMGVPVMKWVMAQRLGYACKLLVMPNLSIKNVAQQSGFNDNLYFSRLFKKVYQLTPTQYQARVTQNAQENKHKRLLQ